ncbi:MAG: PKD domain-containing protein, partial [Psychrosphaera sp.]|nr:PKD domain-containing protein [Psychrosphaera sp.]
MKWSPQWLGKIFEDIDSQLSGVPQWQLYSFTTETKLLHKGDMIEVKEAAQSMKFEGGREDGLAGIEALLQGKIPAGSHIMLFTDEKRSKVKNIDFDKLLKVLKERKVTLHTFLFHRSVAEKAQDGIHYVQSKQGKPIAVSLQQNSLKVPLDQHNPVFDKLFDNRFMSEEMQARIARMPPNRAKQFAPGNQEYIKLALLSGGYAWGLPLERHAKQMEQTNTKLIGRVMGAKMMNKSVRMLSAKVIVTGDTLTGLNMATQMITFDASYTGTNDVSGWEWDFNGDDEIDDYGPSVYTQFDTPGDYRVKLWLTIGEDRQLQYIHLKVVE